MTEYLKMKNHIGIYPKYKIFNILGKGDYTSKTSPHYQINCNHISYRWILPHNFYCFRKKFNIPVDLYVLIQIYL